MILVFILLGLVAGILINIGADSLPTEHRLKPPVCRYCQQPRSPWAWSGMIAYLTRHHRCLSCGAPISLRHVVVELITILLFVFSWLRGGETPTGEQASVLLNILYGIVFILVTVTDLEHRLIPHVIMVPALTLATVGAFLTPHPRFPASGILGGVLGLFSALALYALGAWIARMMEKRHGEPVGGSAFGFGDVTLITFIGLVVGLHEIIPAIVIGIIAGGIVAAIIFVIRGFIKKKYNVFIAFIPYGPFLVLGGAIALYF